MGEVFAAERGPELQLQLLPAQAVSNLYTLYLHHKNKQTNAHLKNLAGHGEGRGRRSP